MGQTVWLRWPQVILGDLNMTSGDPNMTLGDPMVTQVIKQYDSDGMSQVRIVNTAFGNWEYIMYYLNIK